MVSIGHDSGCFSERLVDGDLKQLPGSVLVDCRHTYVADPLSGHVHFPLGCQVGAKELLVKVSANKNGTLSEQPLAAFCQEFRCGDGLRPTRTSLKLFQILRDRPSFNQKIRF